MSVLSPFFCTNFQSDRTPDPEPGESHKAGRKTEDSVLVLPSQLFFFNFLDFMFYEGYGVNWNIY